MTKQQEIDRLKEQVKARTDALYACESFLDGFDGLVEVILLRRKIQRALEV